MISNGLRFVEDDYLRIIPEEGRASIRLRCNGEIMRRPRKGGETIYALCSRCEGYETALRARLRDYAKAQQQAAVGPKKGSRRTRFESSE